MAILLLPRYYYDGVTHRSTLPRWVWTVIAVVISFVVVTAAIGGCIYLCCRAGWSRRRNEYRYQQHANYGYEQQQQQPPVNMFVMVNMDDLAAAGLGGAQAPGQAVGGGAGAGAGLPPAGGAAGGGWGAGLPPARGSGARRAPQGQNQQPGVQAPPPAYRP
ncbi:hypothetical protein DRE_03012 [Drechslerella stenobrocha 248]|uniref:Uncharacterized protein n=1 Tax=Drechslerella stenobrocha 248 TaxID=1043628 RepID=W7I5R7_9PEZI|nr:hypothetical protein DRE_03012 [Drechslerella stenobrocha 248]